MTYGFGDRILGNDACRYRFLGYVPVNSLGADCEVVREEFWHAVLEGGAYIPRQAAYSWMIRLEETAGRRVLTERI